jgi:hypothetical protein
MREDQVQPGTEPRLTDSDPDAEDLEGHSATIYRRRRGPYPLRNSAALPDAEDRTRSERGGHDRRTAR